MSKFYIMLESHQVVPCPDLETWTRLVDWEHRHVGLTTRGGVRVSTAFLGIDHQWGDGPPLVFETMVFGGLHDDFQARCSTWEEAEIMHAAACRMALRLDMILLGWALAALEGPLKAARRLLRLS